MGTVRARNSGFAFFASIPTARSDSRRFLGFVGPPDRHLFRKCIGPEPNHRPGEWMVVPISTRYVPSTTFGVRLLLLCQPPSGVRLLHGSTLKFLLLNVLPAIVTTIGPVDAPMGTTAFNRVAVSTVNRAARPLKVTLLVLSRLYPSTVMVCPTLPNAGRGETDGANPRSMRNTVPSPPPFWEFSVVP